MGSRPSGPRGQAELSVERFYRQNLSRRDGLIVGTWPGVHAAELAVLTSSCRHAVLVCSRACREKEDGMLFYFGWLKK